ncbi:MAG: hypothetical protein D6722_10665 [Bacteroidetes bacterium]|nr:MAG: hypothetical protein D6722_10665 [Bacteroidota bacterium]
MNALLWILAFFVGTTVFFRLFGRRLMQYGLRQIMRRLIKDAEAQSRAYQRNYDDGREAHVYVDQEIKVSAPRSGGRREVSEDDIVEDIEYEDVRPRE